MTDVLLRGDLLRGVLLRGVLLRRVLLREFLLRGVLALMFSAGAQAALEFAFVDGAQIGVDQVISGHVDACPREAWLWGAQGWSDRGGAYLYYSYHGRCGRAVLLQRQADGSYRDISPPNLDGSYTGNKAPNQIGTIGLPTENRPIVLDLNGDGYMDVIHTGDETHGTSGSLVSTGPGSWDLRADVKLWKFGKYTEIRDLNGDGLTDVRAFGGKNAQQYWGKGFVRTALSTGNGFTGTTVPVELPADLPREVVERVDAMDDRYHLTAVIPLDDGSYIVTYGGSYAGSKWHYHIDNGRIVDRGLPGTGTALKPLRIDGRQAIPVQYSSDAGLYRQRANGSFYRDEAGDAPTINDALRGGAYFDEFWDYDLDEDGDTDLVMSNKRNGFGLIMDNDAGVFRLHHRIEHVDGEGMMVADLDGDADYDVVVAGAGNRVGAKRNGRQGSLYLNQLRQPGDAPPVHDAEAPVGVAEPGYAADDGPRGGTPDGIGESPGFNVPWIADPWLADLWDFDAWDAADWGIDADRGGVPDGADAVTDRGAAATPQDRGDAPAPDPAAPAPAAGPEVIAAAVPGRVPLPDFDPESQAWSDFANRVLSSGGRASDHALLGTLYDDPEQCAIAIRKAEWIVEQDTVNGDQYLRAGRQYSDVFQTLAWCDVPPSQASAWVAWGRGHLGETDGSTGWREKKIWWKHRWSRNNPANNYYHSFIVATTVYAMATGDQEWIAWLKSDRLPKMFNYYARSLEGGSREGTGYGASHKEVFRIAKLWRDYDGTEILPQAFIDNSIRFWVHAIAPGSWSLATFGDQTRAKEKVDGYHCDILDNALAIARDPEAIALGKWQIGQMNCFGSSLFKRLILRDYPRVPMPEAVPLAYHAKGAGVLFVRDSWEKDATYLYFMAGKRDEAHQCEDQGAFAVWAKGRWQTTGDHVWHRSGLCFGDISTQNVIRFPGVDRNVRGSVSTLEWSVDDGLLRVDMDLSAAVGQAWLRRVQWRLGANTLRIDDSFDNPGAEFGFEVPGADDDRAPYSSEAWVKTEKTAAGFSSVVSW